MLVGGEKNLSISGQQAREEKERCWERVPNGVLGSGSGVERAEGELGGSRRGRLVESGRERWRGPRIVWRELKGS